MIGTFVTLWFMHKRFRKENQIKLEQYYNEQVSLHSSPGDSKLTGQIAYRQSIMSMSQAKNNLLSVCAIFFTCVEHSSFHRPTVHAPRTPTTPRARPLLVALACCRPT